MLAEFSGLCPEFSLSRATTLNIRRDQARFEIALNGCVQAGPGRSSPLARVSNKIPKRIPEEVMGTIRLLGGATKSSITCSYYGLHAIGYT